MEVVGLWFFCWPALKRQNGDRCERFCDEPDGESSFSGQELDVLSRIVASPCLVVSCPAQGSSILILLRFEVKTTFM